ncbi:retron St85 family effector protein [Shewanella eurypsychrophilus]|uniref:Retron St85 family effector protein n=1 Tax=Shewanella eurypsychrophilus TaxID=2593656 RepID=A0ABX6V1M3_9GAMM|nr:MULTISPECIES: retron St85 family effector protein [Shewanella]QFU21205.1 hypothetical protein FS418_04525 [Shewanella sp. YLB-09]QPG56496.1 retron St85 family effector protein [Shewanella eurypsychrophilus]
MFSENISAFFQNINLEKMRLADVPICVFFCGGENRIDSSEDTIPSMRYMVLQKIKADDPTLFRQIVLAESFQDWINQDVDITNLIDLEVLLAELATLVVLIVEGPGAYAELGVFSVIESIQKKLLPIVNTTVIQERSFVNYGPIDYLKNEKPETEISELTWKVHIESSDNKILSSIDTSDSNLEATVGVIIEDINDSLNKKNVESPLINIEMKGHVFILIHEIVYLLQAVLAKEVKFILGNFFNINYETKYIRKILYILTKLNFVEKSKIKKNDNLYYLSKTNHSLFKYSYKSSDESLKKDNFVSHILLHYFEEPKEKRRLLAINNRAQGE